VRAHGRGSNLVKCNLGGGRRKGREDQHGVARIRSPAARVKSTIEKEREKLSDRNSGGLLHCAINRVLGARKKPKPRTHSPAEGKKEMC